MAISRAQNKNQVSKPRMKKGGSVKQAVSPRRGQQDVTIRGRPKTRAELERQYPPPPDRQSRVTQGVPQDRIGPPRRRPPPVQTRDEEIVIEAPRRRQKQGPELSRGGVIRMRDGGKVEKVMSEFKHGTLHSGSKTGPKVKSRDQAIAIALSEARRAGESVGRKRRRTK